MAPRPPLPLRRRAGATVPVKLAARKAEASAFPLLPATAAALVLLGAAQLAFWWWESRLPDAPETAAIKGNPFVEMARQAAPVDTGRVREAKRLTALTLPQNIQFGDALARVTVTIFTDPSCGPCRAQVQRWTANLPVQGVKQVYKFWPQDPNRLTPGMLLELARQQNATLPFWHSMQGAGTDNLDDGRLLGMLEGAGLPLSEQRKALTDGGAPLMTALEADIQLAKNAGLAPPPVLMVDDYVIDGEVLTPASLAAYVKKRLEGRQLQESDELWLMRK